MVVGSAWMPCVRPTIGMSRSSRARAAIVSSSAVAASISSVAAFVSVTDRVVSTTSDDVSP
ncbi:hypothetical protein D3C83_148970 [compost metagenome]